MSYLNKLRNLKLLIKDLKDKINDKINQTNSEPNNFLAYKSNGLLMKMEEKFVYTSAKMNEIFIKIKQLN